MSAPPSGTRALAARLREALGIFRMLAPSTHQIHHAVEEIREVAEALERSPAASSEGPTPPDDAPTPELNIIGFRAHATGSMGGTIIPNVIYVPEGSRLSHCASCGSLLGVVGDSTGDETPPDRLRSIARNLTVVADRGLDTLGVVALYSLIADVRSVAESLEGAAPSPTAEPPAPVDPLIEKMLYEFAFAYVEYIRDDSGLGVTNACLKRARTDLLTAFAAISEQRDAADTTNAALRAQIESLTPRNTP